MDWARYPAEGIPEGGVGFGPGVVGPSFSFNGVDARIQIEGSLSQAPTNGFTVEAWVFINSTESDSALISQQGTSSYYGWAKGTAEIGGWFHVAFTHDGLVLRNYTDGVLRTTKDTDLSISLDANLTIGAAIVDGMVLSPFDGLIDELSIYNRVLSETEIYSIYQADADGKVLPMAVRSSDPPSTAAVANPPTEFTIEFACQYDPATVQANDLQVNGIPADSFTLVDAFTVRFQFNNAPATTAGVHQLQISENAIEPRYTVEVGNVVVVGGVLPAWSSTFIVAEQLTVEFGSGPQALVNFASKLFLDFPPGGSPGLSFVTTNDNNSLFSQQPTIYSTGQLTFAPAPNQSGSATVTVVLQREAEGEDDGGGAESDTQTFTIEVIQPYPWQNDINPVDTNNDGFVSPIDSLLVIDYINGVESDEAGENSSGPYYDTSGDNYVSPVDVLMVLNVISKSAGDFVPGGGSANGEGESAASRRHSSQESVAAGPAAVGNNSDLIALLASDIASHGSRKRRA